MHESPDTPIHDYCTYLSNSTWASRPVLSSLLAWLICNPTKKIDHMILLSHVEIMHSKYTQAITRCRKLAMTSIGIIQSRTYVNDEFMLHKRLVGEAELLWWDGLKVTGQIFVGILREPCDLTRSPFHIFRELPFFRVKSRKLQIDPPVLDKYTRPSQHG